MASLAPASLSVGLSYFTAIRGFLFFSLSFKAPPLSFYFSVSVIDMQQCVPGAGCRLCSHGRLLKQLGADSRVQNSCKHSGSFGALWNTSFTIADVSHTTQWGRVWSVLMFDKKSVHDKWISELSRLCFCLLAVRSLCWQWLKKGKWQLFV